jgi:hypothetical protein
MCNFFSLVSNGKGKVWYFDKDLRQQIIDGKLSYNSDSHASIAEYFKPESKLTEDQLNKYEFNPFTKRFFVDQINAKDENGFRLDDRERVETICKGLDFNAVVPNWSFVENILKRLGMYIPENPITAEEMPPKEKIVEIMDKVWSEVGSEVGSEVWSEVGSEVGSEVWSKVGSKVGSKVWSEVGRYADICGYYAIKEFMELDYEHPVFELIRLGVVVVDILGKLHVYGKNGKFLGKI